MPVTRTRSEYFAFAVDIFMLVLVLLDLLWLTFDALFTVRYLREVLAQIAPDFTFFYGNTVHPNFLFFDSFILLIFFAEFSIRWAIAVWQRQHSYWFFYPIIHWYDLLGCLPMGSFRILRLLRVGVLLFRLHKWHVIDLRNFTIVRFGIKYYNIAVEEIADRVAVRILQETKSELQRGKHLVDEIIDIVIKPRKQELIDLSTQQLQISLSLHYTQHRKDIRSYLQKLVRHAVTRNKEVANLEKIPLLGQYVKDSLRQAVADITFDVIDSLLQDISDDQNSQIPRVAVQALYEVILAEHNSDRPSLAADIVNHAIDTIIQRVDIKQWKIELENNSQKENDVNN